MADARPTDRSAGLGPPDGPDLAGREPERAGREPERAGLTASLVIADPRRSIDVARERAAEIDRALAALRATLREAPATGDQPAIPAAGPPSGPIASEDPEVAYRWLLLDGHEASCRGRDADAAVIFDMAVRQSPRRIEGHLNLARTLLRLRRYGEARASFARVLELSPDHPLAQAGLADCEWRRRLPVPEPHAAAPRGPRRRWLTAALERAGRRSLLRSGRTH